MCNTNQRDRLQQVLDIVNN